VNGCTFQLRGRGIVLQLGPARHGVVRGTPIDDDRPVWRRNRERQRLVDDDRLSKGFSCNNSFVPGAAALIAS